MDGAYSERAERLYWRLFRVVADLRRRTSEYRAVDGMTLTQCLVLYTLRDIGPARIGDLATHERLSVPTATEAVRQLEQLRFVTRSRDASDARIAWLEITPEGLIAQRAASAELLDSMLTTLSPSELSALYRGLKPLHHFANHLDRLLDER